MQPSAHLATLKHGVTRFRITLECHEAKLVGGSTRGSGAKWVKLEKLNTIPLSVTGRRISLILTEEVAE